MKLEHLSPSRIETFDQCQGKYHAVYEEGLAGESHPLADLGKAIHQMFEIATKALVEAREKKWDLDVCPSQFKDAACRDHKVRAEFLMQVDQLTKNALDWGYFRNIARCVGAELPFDLILPDGTKVRGIIDRLDVWGNKAEVIDLKTQKHPFEPSKLAHNWQALTYNLAARRLYPCVKGPAKVSFWVLRHQVQAVTLTEADADATVKELMTKADEIRSVTVPTYSPSALCPWCPKCETCPVAKQGISKRFRNKAYL